MSYLCALDIILNTGSNKNISFYYLIEEVLVNWRSRNLDIICWFFFMSNDAHYVQNNLKT